LSVEANAPVPLELGVDSSFSRELSLSFFGVFGVTLEADAIVASEEEARRFKLRIMAFPKGQLYM
jgi:hypothetical protein